MQPPAGAKAQPAAEYVARLAPMNQSIAGGRAHGEARLTVNGDELTIAISMQGVAPGMVHWQHIHGFTSGRAASCSAASADTNHDGVIDLIETEPASGTTMVPLDTDPAAMDVAHGTYPKASATGSYHYRQTVSLRALEAAFTKAFPGQKLDLARRVIYVHGVPAGTKLPASVQTLGPIPAHVTIPIACGKVARHFYSGSLPLVARSAGFDSRQGPPAGARGSSKLPPIEAAKR